jgi:protein-tyrosine-phosphatase
MSDGSTTTFGFVCVRNAGRSQMSAAFAERERAKRALDDCVEIRSGGTRPADAIHDVVVEAMDEVGVDVSDRTPTAVSTAALESCDVVATMGCSTLELDAETVEVRDWALPDPDGEHIERVRAIRDEVADRVEALFDEFHEHK